MSEVILYPTETVYGLGVNALDSVALEQLYALKGRDAAKAASWLVPDITAIERYAEMSKTARKLAERFLPGPLTLVLKARTSVPREVLPESGTIGFRVSSDPNASALAHASAYPLTCTSANVSGMPTLPTPEVILAQFGEKAAMIGQVIDDGPREGEASTVVSVIGDTCEVLREGAIAASDIMGACSH